MSELNTSNINVPSVATMTRHLTDSNPHPQYLQTSDVLSVIKAQIHMSDLADVSYGSGIVEQSILIYDGQNGWNASSISAIASSILVPYATSTTSGAVLLTQPSRVLESNDGSTVITPAALSKWAELVGNVDSGNFLTTLSAKLADPSITVPFDIAQLKNVKLDPPVSVGQVLQIYSYDGTTAWWRNGDLPISKANTTTYGLVTIADPTEALFGEYTSAAWDQMQLSGHQVPSILTVHKLLGPQYVSAVHTSTITSNNVAISTVVVVDSCDVVMSNITVNRTSSLIVNKNGIANSCGANGGTISVINGTALDATIVGTSAVGYGIASGVLDVTAGGKAFGATLGQYGNLNVVNGEVCNVVLLAGITNGTNWVPQSNVLSVNSNGHAHQVTLGEFLTPAVESTMVLNYSTTFETATAEVWAQGNIEHIICNAGSLLAVNGGGKVYHPTVRGYNARVNIANGGYVEDMSVYKGGIISVGPGGEVNGMIVYDSAKLIVASGGRVGGLVTLGPCNIVSATGAEIGHVGLVASDVKLYSSNTSDYNISSGVNGLLVTFSANNHPTGLRKEYEITSTVNNETVVSIGYAFVPIAVQNRIPVPGDPGVNVYTMDVAGTGVWEDVVSGTAQWYVTF